MSRYFMIQSWVGSHENEPDYNGQQCGERNVRSSEVIPMYDQYGNANTSAFSDAAIAERTGGKKQSKVSLRDRILPQSKRLDTLTAQIKELENEYRQGKMDIEEYSMLRAVLFAKKEKAWILYCKAVGMPPVDTSENEEETPKVNGQTVFHLDDVCVDNVTHNPINGGSFMASISDDNFFKAVAQKACKLRETALEYKHKVSKYINQLKAV